MPDTTPPPADELKPSERFYRMGCWVNCGMFVTMVAALGTLIWLIVAETRRDKTPLIAEYFLPKFSPEDEAVIRGVLDAQVAAWNKGDLDGFMKGYWKDEKLSFISNGAITQGWEATRERYKKRYFTPNADGKLGERGELSFAGLHFEGFGPDGAMVRGRYILKLEKETATGRFTLGFRRLPDGWKIISDHTSVDCPPAEKKDKKPE